MDVSVVMFALVGLMAAAYCGYGVIVVAPLAIIFALMMTNVSSIAPVFSGVFMAKLAFFVQLYLPVFLLGAVFGKLFDVSGASRSVALQVLKVVGVNRSILGLVVMCAVLTYSGVSLFVVVFTVYPFAAELFKANNVPKRFIPASIALGAFSFTMDALPGSPQILNIIPTTFFGTTAWAAPKLGLLTSFYILVVGLLFIEVSRMRAQGRGETYGENHKNEPSSPESFVLPCALISILPLILIGLVNFALVHYMPIWYGGSSEFVLPGLKPPLDNQVSKMVSIWAVEGALLTGILSLLILFFKRIRSYSGRVILNSSITGAIFAALSSASEFAFGSVISIMPGFIILSEKVNLFSDPLVNQAVAINLLSGVTASASGGLSLALGAMSDNFIASAVNGKVPMEVLHRISSLSAGGMDTLPHNGAIITLLAVTGLTHRQSYGPIFGITLIKLSSSFFAIAAYYIFGLV